MSVQVEMYKLLEKDSHRGGNVNYPLGEEEGCPEVENEHYFKKKNPITPKQETSCTEPLGTDQPPTAVLSVRILFARVVGRTW